ncbi:hypothetical protein FGG65_gp13 [Corynebacterium phage phi673]|uniref:Uncharacterized protein n=2 Tax=Ikedavirus TaxID=2560149 RepID=A0A2H4PIX2_9CAUD|nr:hypothetical protein FGG65_gp13 [Corynebacterium phage phi673]YP_009639748.1 hypothetical protein FGG66_gp13 [Corynebacterium phage phi674]ATW62875.1 hypothetical protein phi673_gp13 [Corynebacterium phage phi673]ATW62931.1 hypothetical protein phi674_gp13 [Corynebacterium phage phi674]
MAGRITARRLEVLLSGLPEDNAITRALNDGHTWTTTHVILWQMLGKLTDLAGIVRSAVQAKGKFKWPKDPWTKPDDGKTIGHVAKEDQPLAVDFLTSMYASPST